MIDDQPVNLNAHRMVRDMKRAQEAISAALREPIQAPAYICHPDDAPAMYEAVTGQPAPPEMYPALRAVAPPPEP